MRLDGVIEDDERERKLPCLDFGSFALSFPERGHNSFVSADDLATVLPKFAGDLRGFWLFRAESGVCGVASCRARLLREGSRVAGLAILHHGQKVEIEGKEARFFEIRKVSLTEGSHLVGRKCAFCRKAHAIGETVYRCPLCGSGYCEDCWKELYRQRCCSRNCRFSPGALKD